MSASDRLYVRTSKSFKTNTQLLIDQLYAMGLRDDQSLSAYVIEAVKQKRTRDSAIVNQQNENIVRTSTNGNARAV